MSSRMSATLQVIKKLPTVLGPPEGRDVPLGLLGSEILAFGTAKKWDKRPEGGGLVIDYLPKGCRKARRVVLAFNELGMWVMNQGLISIPSVPSR